MIVLVIKGDRLNVFSLVSGTSLSKLPMDGFTLTEILRLHFLSSGAKGSETNNRWRYQQRGGYTPQDDAGLEFRRNETTILKSLAETNVFDLNEGGWLTCGFWK